MTHFLMGQMTSIKTFFLLVPAHHSDSTKAKTGPSDRRRMDTWKRKYSIVLQKFPWKTYLIILLQLALQTKGFLDAVRNVGVAWCRFTRNPGIEGKNCKVGIKRCNRKPGEKTHTHPDEALTFHGKRSVHSIFSLRLALFRERRVKVQGVLYKSRTWKRAQQGGDNVMRFPALGKI